MEVLLLLVVVVKVNGKLNLQSYTVNNPENMQP